jgi:hypothetical protein
MATKISDTEMTSDLTRHSARAAGGGGWTVSWLPGRTLTQSQAVTAMMIAEAVIVHTDDLADNSSRWWLHLDGLAAELGTTGPNAVAKASLSPEDHADIPEVITLAFDSQPGRRGYLLSTDRGTGMARVRINGETVIMPAAHLQLAGGEPETAGQGRAAGTAPAEACGSGPLNLTQPERSALINVMTDHEWSVLLAFIAGYAPEVFDQAVIARSESFADELFGRIEERDEAEYRAEPDGYCIACGENASWFIGFEGPQHFRGPHKLVTGSERRELFTPEDGHAPQVAWRYPDAAPGGAQ